MREIKFRAWDGHQMLDHIFADTSPEGWVWCHNPCKVGVRAIIQFTGLRDKNGKEIYEGDILECISDIVKISTGEKTGKQSRKVCSVVYVPEQAHFTTQRPSGHIETGFGITQAIIGKWYEVIGNIYENPELLSNP